MNYQVCTNCNMKSKNVIVAVIVYMFILQLKSSDPYKKYLKASHYSICFFREGLAIHAWLKIH